MTLKWTVHVTSKPQRGLKKRQVTVFRPKLKQLIYDNFETVRDSMLVLITNRKLHMSFRLVPTSVTLNDLKRRNSS